MNATDDCGMTPFLEAYHRRHKEVVKLLLDHLDENGKTKIVKLLLKIYNVEESGLNAKNDFGSTALMAACHRGYTEVVKLLLDHTDETTDFNAKDRFGWTALMCACRLGHTDIVKLLLDHSDGTIDINAKDDNFGVTALMWACIEGRTDVVKLLLQYSDELRKKGSQGVIDLDAKDFYGKTAQMYAYNTEIVQLLSNYRIRTFWVDWFHFTFRSIFEKFYNTVSKRK